MTTSAGAQLLKLQLVPEANRLASGQLPNFVVSVRNEGTQPVRFLKYMLDYRLKAAMVAQNTGQGASYELQPFRTARWDTASLQDVTILQPGQELKHSLQFPDAWEFGWIQRHSQPPVVTPGYRLKGFPAGTFSFSTGLFEQMGIYVGADGVFDHRLEGKRLPHEIPGSDIWGSLQATSLEAEASIQFG